MSERLMLPAIEMRLGALLEFNRRKDGSDVRSVTRYDPL